MSRKRGLSAEDKALWSRVAATIAPMQPFRKDPAPEVPPKPSAALAKAAVAKAAAGFATALLPSSFRIGGFSIDASPLGRNPRVSHDLAPNPGERLAAQPVRMDAKAHRQMTRGKMRPEARLDLHGMTLAVAQSALTNFVMTAHSRGNRLVLVITGKGKAGGPDAPLPIRPGALRHNVPYWLQMMPLGPIVLQVTPAHRSHGGEGAYYVYLRK